MMRGKTWSALGVAAVLAAGLMATPAAAQQKTVNFYNWSDYVDPKILEEFTKETGIRVKYDTFDSNEILETKLLAGRSGYDVVVPSGAFLQRQIKAGIFRKLDKSKLPNLVHLWPEVTSRLGVYDPGNEHAVNYMWGTTGIGYNVKAVEARMGKDYKVDSWDLIFKPENISKFRDCGVMMLDAADEIIPAALNYLGLNPDSKDPADFAKAQELLMSIRPNIRKFHSSEYIEGLANGNVCLVVGWSGDVKQAKSRAEEAKKGVVIEYAIPKEGALMWFDNLAIPRDARNVEEAHALINFLQRPDVAARNTNFIQYPSGNLAAQAMVDKEVLNNPGIYPTPEAMKKLFTVTAYDQKSQRELSRTWTRIKSGR
jgi:putrescine transport system substrate-binding protein